MKKIILIILTAFCLNAYSQAQNTIKSKTSAGREIIVLNKSKTSTGKEIILNYDNALFREFADTTQAETAVIYDIENSCDDWSKTKVNKTTGESRTMSKEGLIISKKGKNGLAIVWSTLSSESYALGIVVVGSSNCIYKGDQIIVMFTDGSSMTLSNELGFNCNSQSFVYFGGGFGKISKLNDLKTKTIKTVRVRMAEGYVEEDFSEENQIAFKNILKCLTQI